MAVPQDAVAVFAVTLLIVTAPGADGAVVKLALDCEPHPPSASQASTAIVYSVPEVRPDKLADRAVPVGIHAPPFRLYWYPEGVVPVLAVHCAAAVVPVIDEITGVPGAEGG